MPPLPRVPTRLAPPITPLCLPTLTAAGAQNGVFSLGHASPSYAEREIRPPSQNERDMLYVDTFFILRVFRPSRFQEAVLGMARLCCTAEAAAVSRRACRHLQYESRREPQNRNAAANAAAWPSRAGNRVEIS